MLKNSLIFNNGHFDGNNKPHKEYWDIYINLTMIKKNIFFDHHREKPHSNFLIV